MWGAGQRIWKNLQHCPIPFLPTRQDCMPTDCKGGTIKQGRILSLSRMSLSFPLLVRPVIFTDKNKIAKGPWPISAGSWRTSHATGLEDQLHVCVVGASRGGVAAARWMYMLISGNRLDFSVNKVGILLFW